MVQELGLETLELRRKQARLIIKYKIAHNLIEVDKSKYLTPANEMRTC
jgi:hypothetical protein